MPTVTAQPLTMGILLLTVGTPWLTIGASLLTVEPGMLTVLTVLPPRCQAVVRSILLLDPSNWQPPCRRCWT